MLRFTFPCPRTILHSRPLLPDSQGGLKGGVKLCTILISFSVSKSPWAHLYVVGMLRLYVFDINQPNSPTPFYSVLVSISVFMALSTNFIPSILPTTLRFLTLSFRSCLCLIGPFSYTSLYESLLHPGGWLDLKQQLTNSKSFDATYAQGGCQIPTVSISQRFFFLRGRGWG